MCLVCLPFLLFCVSTGNQEASGSKYSWEPDHTEIDWYLDGQQYFTKCSFGLVWFLLGRFEVSEWHSMEDLGHVNTLATLNPNCGKTLRILRNSYLQIYEPIPKLTFLAIIQLHAHGPPTYINTKIWTRDGKLPSAAGLISRFTFV